MKIWIEQLENANSKCSKLCEGGLSAFNKYNRPFINTQRQLLKTQDMLSAEAMLGNNRTITFSIVLQNMLQPKNNNRTEAIKAGQYKEIKSEEDSCTFVN